MLKDPSMGELCYACIFGGCGGIRTMMRERDKERDKERERGRYPPNAHANATIQVKPYRLELLKEERERERDESLRERERDTSLSSRVSRAVTMFGGERWAKGGGLRQAMRGGLVTIGI
jgi:hypothetical protein